MSNWELIDYNPHNGLKKYIGTDVGDDDTVLIRYEQSGDAIKQILDRNKAAQNEAWDRKADMVKVASIPVHVQMEWLTKFGVHPWKPEHEAARTRLLNSSDYRYLKCADIYI